MFKKVFALDRYDIDNPVIQDALDEWAVHNEFALDVVNIVYRHSIIESLEGGHYSPEVESGLRQLLIIMKEQCVDSFFYEYY